MSRLLSSARPQRSVAILLTLLLVAVAAILWRSTLPETISVRASFPQTIGLYPGDDVRVVGVPMGTISEIIPRGDHVMVEMQLDAATPVAAGTGAVIVPPGILSSRYIQLTKPWTGGPQLADGATIAEPRTEAPLEIDDVTRELDRFLAALGPRGANRHGALSELFSSSAKALDGNGRLLRRALSDVAASLDTLGHSSGNIVTTLEKLQTFATALSSSDGEIRRAERALAAVSTQLASQRAQLRATIHNLSVATRAITGFMKRNRGTLTADIGKLATLSVTLVDQQRELKEILDLSSIGTEGIFGAANLTTGTLDSRVDLTPLIRDYPTALCQLLQGAGQPKLCSAVRKNSKGR